MGAIYICLRCCYKTNRKQSMLNHFSRKNICKVVIEDIPRESLKAIATSDHVYNKVVPPEVKGVLSERQINAIFCVLHEVLGTSESDEEFAIRKQVLLEEFRKCQEAGAAKRAQRRQQQHQADQTKP